MYTNQLNKSINALTKNNYCSEVAKLQDLEIKIRGGYVLK